MSEFPLDPQLAKMVVAAPEFRSLDRPSRPISACKPSPHSEESLLRLLRRLACILLILSKLALSSFRPADPQKGVSNRPADVKTQSKLSLKVLTDPLTGAPTKSFPLPPCSRCPACLCGRVRLPKLQMKLKHDSLTLTVRPCTASLGCICQIIWHIECIQAFLPSIGLMSRLLSLAFSCISPSLALNWLYSIATILQLRYAAKPSLSFI